MALLHPKQIAQGGATTGQALVWSGSVWAPSSSVLSRNTAATANTLLQYKLQDTGTPWVNSGASGSLNMTAVAGQVTRSAADGVVGESLVLIGTGSAACGINTGATSTAQPATNVTMSCWIRPTGAFATNVTLFAKMYTTSSTSPFNSVGLNITSGKPYFRVSVAATAADASVATGETLALGAWWCLAGTYDGTTVRLYINGRQAATAAQSGSIDYNATPGAWCIGGNPFSTLNNFDGTICECRFEDTVRSASYLKTYYDQIMVTGAYLL